MEKESYCTKTSKIGISLLMAGLITYGSYEFSRFFCDTALPHIAGKLEKIALENKK